MIHETAIVERGALIGSETKVWHHTHVCSDAIVGSGCTLGKNVYVAGGARIGDRVKVQNNVSIYDGVVLEDETFVGPSAVFTNDLHPRAFGDWELVSTIVRRGASIGANATIICGVEVGEYALVGAGAVLTRSLDAHELVVGNPARRLGWACRCGRLASRAEERPSDLRCEVCREMGVSWT